jgi:hypothetical protein
VKTFWQLLRIAFWMLPLQRALVVIGGLLVIAGLFTGPALSSIGVTLMLVVPLLAGGVLLRMLSASRALLLRPHARGRLLAGTISILLLVSIAGIAVQWIEMRWAPPKYRPDLDYYVLTFSMALSFGTLCTVTMFVASRSPLWTLLILVIWQAPGLLLHLLGLEDASRLLGSPVSLAMDAAVWTGFGIWYVRARRVHASSWRRRESTAEETDAMPPAVPATREQAMTRWLLGGATPLRIGLQCLAAALGVLVIQWIFARDAALGPRHAMMFGTLSLVGVVAGAVSRTMAGHARGLWLTAGRTRLALHAWTERQMLLVLLAIFAAVAIATTLVWWLLPRPDASFGYLLCAVLAPGFAAAWLGLMQQHRRSLFDALAAIGIFLGWSYGLVGPLFSGVPADRWEILGAEVALAVLLREVAYVRWRSADWRRIQRA